MSARTIPSASPDVKAWLISTLGPLLAPTPVVGKMPELTGSAQSFVLVRADLQNRATPISRYCRVGIQGWSIRSNGDADTGAAFDLAANAGSALERLPLAGILLDAEVQSGPYEVVDATYQRVYAYTTVLLEVCI